MKRLLLLAALSFVATAALAQTAPAWNENRMTWDAPTACSIASEPLSRCPVASYTVEHSRGQAGPWASIASVPSTQLTYTHVAIGGENCYRFRAVNTIAGASAPTAAMLCRTNAEPPPPQIPPGPPTNPRFVTIAATNDFRHNVTPVVSILGGNRPGSVFGLVPLGRATQGAPIFTYRGQSYCRVEVGTKELWGTKDATNLAAPCSRA